MLGPPKLRVADQPITISLESLVPADHFYRHLDATLDLTFVREWVRDRYADRGRPSIDPVVFFKLQLIMFFEGLRSERRLIDTASLHLAHRWYLGYSVDEPLPDHSSLTRIRQRLGLPIFQRFFEHVVELCQQAGLIWGRELFFDATKVRANAALNGVVPRFYLQAKAQAHEHLAALFADEPVIQPDTAGVPSRIVPDEGPVDPLPAEPATRLPTALSAETEAALAEANRMSWKLEAAGAAAARSGPPGGARLPTPQRSASQSDGSGRRTHERWAALRVGVS
jgi:transposase